MSFNTLNYSVCKSLSRIKGQYSHVICACYHNMTQYLFVSCEFATNNFAEKLYRS